MSRTSSIIPQEQCVNFTCDSCKKHCVYSGSVCQIRGCGKKVHREPGCAMQLMCNVKGFGLAVCNVCAAHGVSLKEQKADVFEYN